MKSSNRRHLAIFNKSVVEQIFKGKKTIESRFSKNRIAPFGMVNIGDTIYIKPSGEDVVGRFRVKKVISFEGMDQADWQVIQSKYGQLLSLGSAQDNDQFLKQHTQAKYGTLIFIDQVEKFLTAPVKFAKKDLRGWMVLKDD